MSENTGREYPMDFYFLQPGNKPDDINGQASGQTWGGGQQWNVINHPMDMFSRIKTMCGDKFYVRTLRIGGHGNTDRFRIGETLVSREPLGDVVKKPLLATLLMRELKGIAKDYLKFFKPGKSLIILDSCLTGGDDLLLKSVSDAFGGVRVIAPFAEQSVNEAPPLLEGDARVCYEDKCWSVHNPNELIGGHSIQGVVEYFRSVLSL